MARESVDETIENRKRSLQKQKERTSITAKLPSGKQFTFQLPRRLQELYDKIQEEKAENERKIEESEKADSPSAELTRLTIEIYQRRKIMLDAIEHEVLKFQFYEKAWIHIREELAEMSTTSNALAVIFDKIGEDNWGVSFAIIEPSGKVVPWKKTVVFPDSPFQESTGISKEELQGIRELRESKDFKEEPSGKIKKKR